MRFGLFAKRWATRIHKWSALLIGLQVVIWIAGGLVMSALPIGQVRGEHKITPPAAVAIDPSGLVSPSDAMASAGLQSLKEARLEAMDGEPVWRLSPPEGPVATVSAVTGEVLSPVSEALARRIAISDYSGPGALTSVEFVHDPPHEYGRAVPVWKAQFDDTGRTTLWIDPASAEVRARRSSVWRFYDFFWRLHVMDYDDGENFNHPLLVASAACALLFTLSGMVLLVIRMRRAIRTFRAN